MEQTFFRNMKPLPKIEQEPEPKGKRRIRRNIWGNWVGYIGRVRWIDFGDCPERTAEDSANEWLEGNAE